MSSFSCPHYDLANDFCTRLKTDCVPGRKGCIASGSEFLVPAEERVRAKEEEKRKAALELRAPLPGMKSRTARPR